MRRSRRSRTVPAPAHEVADLADLLRVALGSGFTVMSALALVCAHIATPTAVAFASVLSTDPADDLRSPVDALAVLPVQLGDASRELCVALVGAARYGAPVVPALERVASGSDLEVAVADTRTQASAAKALGRDSIACER